MSLPATQQPANTEVTVLTVPTVQICEVCGNDFSPKNHNGVKARFCSDTCRNRYHRNPPAEHGLYVGKVFDVSFRNANVRAKSVKGGWKYEFVAEMTADDFDLFNGHDLTGSAFESQIECTEVAQPGLFHDGPKPKKEQKPYGQEAVELYKNGFYFNPHVMAKVGTDTEYLEWLKTQPCCIRGSMSADKAHEGDVVAAHVRRIAAGAGTATKPMYSAVPMCNRHHQLQHQHGESQVGGKEWIDRERARHLSRWMAHVVFGKESMGHVRPDLLTIWCKAEDIAQYLPEVYRG